MALAATVLNIGDLRGARADDAPMKPPAEQELKNPEWIKAGRAHFVQA